MAQPQKKTPDKAPDLDAWLCNNPTLRGPDGTAYRVGDEVPSFTDWDDQAQERLSRMGYVVKRRDFKGTRTTVNIAVPPPRLMAIPAPKGANKEKVWDRMPRVDHFLKFNDGEDTDDVEVTGATLDPQPLVMLEPGTTVQLADGTQFMVPNDPESGTPSEQMDKQEDNQTPCLWCGEAFDGIAAMKAHEARIHGSASR
jgi:hypothetical protein